MFIENPKKRNEIKKIFDGLRFDRNSIDFKPREEKKIKTEENLEKLFTPKFYTCGKYYENHIKNCKMIKRSKQKEKCITCGE